MRRYAPVNTQAQAETDESLNKQIVEAFVCVQPIFVSCVVITTSYVNVCIGHKGNLWCSTVRGILVGKTKRGKFLNKSFSGTEGPLALFFELSKNKRQM